MNTGAQKIHSAQPVFFCTRISGLPAVVETQGSLVGVLDVRVCE